MPNWIATARLEWSAEKAIKKSMIPAGWPWHPEHAHAKGVGMAPIAPGEIQSAGFF